MCTTKRVNCVSAKLSQRAGISASEAGLCTRSCAHTERPDARHFISVETVDGAWIAGMSRDESDLLLAALWDHTINTEHVFVWQWDEGDIMMWDNRRTMYRRDLFDPAFVRIMHRTR